MFDDLKKFIKIISSSLAIEPDKMQSSIEAPGKMFDKKAYYIAVIIVLTSLISFLHFSVLKNLSPYIILTVIY